MSDQTSERIEGKFDEVKGRGKEAWGKATGDKQTEAEGKFDQAKGQVKQGMADIKDKVDDKVKNLANR